MKDKITEAVNGLEKFIGDGPLGANTIPGNTPEGRKAREDAFFQLWVLKEVFKEMVKDLTEVNTLKSQLKEWNPWLIK